MEFALSAITGDLCSRFITYLVNKCTDRWSSEEKLQRLQLLLVRLHIVVEEAEGRYITNSQMLLQLRTITQAMYRGYSALEEFRSSQQIQAQRQVNRAHLGMQRSRDFSQLSQSKIRRQVSISNPWLLITPAKRFRKTESTVNRLLEDLETAIADMKEFVIFLGGCERMCRRPNDTYLYVDNFMFGRVVEKQKIINILLQDNPVAYGAPLAVLPVIGGCRVGKKTLVWCACNDDKIRSYYPSILYLKGDKIRSVDKGIFSCARTLVVIEFVSDVSDEDWEDFHSLMAKWMGKGSKIILISRFERISRFATATPIYLGSLSPDEYNYLFKVLAFGSADPTDHPRLATIGYKLGTLLGGLLLSANILGYMLRKDLDVQFWLHILRRYTEAVDNNLTEFGAHPRALHEEERPADITKFSSSQSASSYSLRMMPPRSGTGDICTRELSNVTFGDLVAGSYTVLPQGEYQIMVWESRIPPFTKFVATCVEEKVHCVGLTGKKRPREIDL